MSNIDIEELMQPGFLSSGYYKNSLNPSQTLYNTTNKSKYKPSLDEYDGNSGIIASNSNYDEIDKNMIITDEIDYSLD